MIIGAEQIAEARRLQAEGHSQRAIAKAIGKPRHLELFARVDAEHPLPLGWQSWSNEAGQDDTRAPGPDTRETGETTTLGCTQP